MLRLDGQKLSQILREKYRLDILKSKIQPGLAVVLVGEDEASKVYVANKEKACKAAGITSRICKLPSDCQLTELKKTIDVLNKDTQIHGILVQLPLPKHIDKNKVFSWVDSLKDVDALGVRSMGLLFQGRPQCEPCTPSGVMRLLEHYGLSVKGKRAVVVGRSVIVGLPMFQLLQRAGATVTLCHSQTENLRVHTSEADIVVVAAGRPRFLGAKDFKKGSVVIDVGIHRIDTLSSAQKGLGKKKKLCGDVLYDELEGYAKAATPVPGGVGPMTITMLLENTLTLSGIYSKKV